MKKKKTIKRSNPQDATLRNIRALKKRVEVLEFRLKFLLSRLDAMPSDAVNGKELEQERRRRRYESMKEYIQAYLEQERRRRKY